MWFSFLLRLTGSIIGGTLGWRLAMWTGGWGRSVTQSRAIVLLVVCGAGLGILLMPYLTVKPARALGRKMRRVPTQDLVAAGIGLIAGLVISALLALPLSMLPTPLGAVLPIVVSAIFGYGGIVATVGRKKELFEFFGSRRGSGSANNEPARRSPNGALKVLVDTSAIIDGRVADISQTGFLRGALVIPRFVLNELQRIADSADTLRRNRGRRGLDMLNKLQKESVVPVEVSELEVREINDVDGKLVKMAKMLHAPIITNDYNLNRVAELQGVTVLNVNELANALKPVVLPGEEMVVRIIQEGKELGQGVGYLDDGTMIVVENGRRHLNSDLDVVVTRVLQTVAGRMIFAHPKID